MFLDTSGGGGWDPDEPEERPVDKKKWDLPLCLGYTVLSIFFCTLTIGAFWTNNLGTAASFLILTAFTASAATCIFIWMRYGWWIVKARYTRK